MSGHADEHTTRAPGSRRPRSAVLLALLLAVCAGSVAACGGSTTHGSGQSAETSPGVPAGEQATEAQGARWRAAHLKKSEAIEEGEIKKKLAAVKLARARAASAEREKRSNAAKKHAADGEKQHSTSSGKQRGEKPKPKKAAKPQPPAGESPAEKAARRQFAKEEAEEQAAFKRQERQEAAGR
jgi:hypothetical protein